MSDKILNIINKQKGVVFSQKELLKENRILQSELDKRITDILHKIEFTNLSPQNSYKMCMKLQSFLKKKRSIKKIGEIYIPRTETGNYIKNSIVLKKKEDKYIKNGSK
jgi:hypothetical protein